MQRLIPLPLPAGEDLVRLGGWHDGNITGRGNVTQSESEWQETESKTIRKDYRNSSSPVKSHLAV